MFVENFVGFLDKFFEDFGDFFVFFVFLGEFLWWFFGFVWVVFFYVVVFCYVFEDEDGFVVGCVDEYEVNWEFDVFLNGFSKFVGFFSVYFFSVFVGYDFVFDGGEVNVEGQIVFVEVEFNVKGFEEFFFVVDFVGVVVEY